MQCNIWLLLSLAALFICRVACLPSGPPIGSPTNFNYVCNALAPNPGSAHGTATSGDGGYRLEISPPMTQVVNGFTYSPDTVYTVSISMGGTIQGFLVQARIPDDTPTLGVSPMLLGSFQASTGHQTYDCDSMAGAANEATITHSQRQNANSVEFTWTSPSLAGDVNFYYTVVRQTAIHFDAIDARQAGVTFVTPPPPTTPGPTVATTVSTATTGTPGTTQPPVTLPPGNPTLPVRAPEDYRLQVTSPDGCSLADCDLFIGIDTNTGNTEYLDIFMEGNAAGWVAVGFSATPNMFSADVVSCNRLGDDIVAIDGWNPAAFSRASSTDTIQDVLLHNASFNSPRLSCTVSKRIAPSGTGEDLPLNDFLFVIFARRVSVSTQLNSLSSHTVDGTAVRGLSAMPLAITNDTGTLEPPTTPEPQAITRPPGLTTPVRAPEDYRLQVTSPDGCSLADCDLFIGIDTNTGNTEYLDIFMEGNAAGWVAVGFSETPNMFLADVVSCNRLGDNIVAIDGWNPASPARGSITDTIQDVFLHDASFNSPRLSCTVSKSIAPSGTGEDLDLTNNLFVIFARRVSTSIQLNNLDTHAVDGTAVRGASAMQFAVAADNGTAGGNVFDTVHRPNLIRAHGILMIIAWPMLAVTAIFFALFMRPALPNGEWFQVHRALLLISLFIGAAAFVLIFIALSNSGGLVNIRNNVSLTHLILGVIIMALQIINPLIAICRCHPGSKHRWIFNLLHGSAIGLLAEILALINVALGLSIFSRSLGQLQFRSNLAPLWLFVSWDVFYIALVIVLFVIFTIVAIYTNKNGLAPSVIKSLLPADQTDKKPVESPGINLDSALGDKPPEKPAPKKKAPSKDAPLRWAALVVYLAITIPVLVAVIVMVALPEN